MDDLIPYKHIDITSFQPPRLIRWCTCSSKPFPGSTVYAKSVLTREVLEPGAGHSWCWVLSDRNCEVLGEDNRLVPRIGRDVIL